MCMVMIETGRAESRSCAQVWQADPATQATQSTARETPAPRKDEDDDDEATTSAIVLQALLGEGSTFGTPAERGAEDSAMHGVSGDGGGAVEAATPALMHSEDTPMMDSGAADSLARLSLSGSGGTAGMALRGAGAAPSAGALRRQRQGLFLLQEPVTWNALQHSWADAAFSSDVEPRSHPALAKKQGVLCAGQSHASMLRSYLPLPRSPQPWLRNCVSLQTMRVENKEICDNAVSARD